MSSYYYLFPLTAALGNLALLALHYKKRHALNRILFLLYALLAGVNIPAVFMLEATGTDEAMFWLFILRHSLFFLPLCLLILAAFLSGRKLINSLTVIALIYLSCFLVAADFTYMTGQPLLVVEMRAHAWGYFPVLSRLAIILLSGGYVFCFGVSLFYLLVPISPLRGFSLRTALFFYAIWWPGIMLNGLPLAGFEIPPFGNGIDALVSLIFSATLHRRRIGFFTPGPLRALSELLTAASFGLLCGFLFLIMPLAVSSALPIVIGLLMATCSLGFLQWLKHNPEPEIEGDLATRLVPFLLSRQEIRICELVQDGYSKRDILVFLNIADGTLRNHLMSIYEKTIHRTSNVPEDSRDKLQRLTVFLHRIAEKPIQT